MKPLGSDDKGEGFYTPPNSPSMVGASHSDVTYIDHTGIVLAAPPRRQSQFLLQIEEINDKPRRRATSEEIVALQQRRQGMFLTNQSNRGEVDPCNLAETIVHSTGVTRRHDQVTIIVEIPLHSRLGLQNQPFGRSTFEWTPMLPLGTDQEVILTI